MHTESRSLRTLSPLESSQTVMIILYNRYNGNASYQRARVYGDDRGKGKGGLEKKKKMKRERERVVSIRKTLFTIERP